MTTYLLGVQWENSSMRLACFRRTNSGKTTLVNTLTLPVESFKNWIREHIPQNASVQAVITIPESHIILKELELPNVKAAELAEAVHWELTGKSEAGDDSVISWQVIEKQDNLLRVAAMIMKKAEVAAAVSFFADAGIELTAIEPLSISAARVVTVPGETSVLLSLEGAEVLAVFVRHHVPIFSTSFTIPLTETAQHAKHLSRDASSSLVSQLKRVITYWNSKETKVSSIIVIGDAASFSGFKRDVARALAIPLAIGRMKPGMPVGYAAEAGAALRGEDEAVNFLPKENLLSLEKKAFGSYARMRLWQFTKVNILVLILLAAVSCFLWVSQMTYARNITQTERFIDNHPAQKYVAHITSVNTLLTHVATLMASQEDTGARLRYLSGVTPPKLHFTSLKMVGGTKEEWAISGTGNRGDILAFYYKLKADGNVKDVTMPYSNFDQETDSPFTVNIVW